MTQNDGGGRKLSGGGSGGAVIVGTSLVIVMGKSAEAEFDDGSVTVTYNVSAPIPSYFASGVYIKPASDMFAYCIGPLKVI